MTKTFLKFIFALPGLLLLLTLLMTSCHKDEVSDIYDLLLQEQTVQLSQNGSAAVEILSGNSLYAATSSQPRIAQAKIEGNNVVISALQYGQSIVTVTDKAGKTASVTVNVQGSFAIDLSRYSVTDYEGGSKSRVRILDGNGTYRTVSADPSVIEATVENGNEIVLTTGSAGQTTVIVTDERGQQSEIEVQVLEIVELVLGMDPYILHEGAPAGTTRIAFTQANGQSGEYRVVSSDRSIVSITETHYANNVAYFYYRVNGFGTAQITVTDAAGQTAGFTVEIHPREMTGIGQDPTLYAGQTKTYLITGNSPYSIVSNSNPGVANVTVNGNYLSVATLSVGTTEITLSDVTGREATCTVTAIAGLTDTDILADDRIRVQIPYQNLEYIYGESPGEFFTTVTDDGTVTVEYATGTTASSRTYVTFSGGTEPGIKRFVAGRGSSTMNNVTRVEVLKNENGKIWVAVTYSGVSVPQIYAFVGALPE